MRPIDPDFSKGLSVVAITQGECCVWSDDLAPDTAPLRIHPKVHTGKKQFHTANKGESHRGHEVEKFSKEYLESICMSLVGAKEILLITHGTGKSSAFGVFTEHVNSHRMDLSTRIIGHIEVDLTNLTDSQLLALSRDWSQAHIS